jgi:hypothetical protein
VLWNAFKEATSCLGLIAKSNERLDQNAPFRVSFLSLLCPTNKGGGAPDVEIMNGWNSPSNKGTASSLKLRGVSTLQHAATHSTALQHRWHVALLLFTPWPQLATLRYHARQYTATHCNAIQRTATQMAPSGTIYTVSPWRPSQRCNQVVSRCNALKHTVMHYNALKLTATQFNALHCIATHCHGKNHNNSITLLRWI